MQAIQTSCTKFFKEPEFVYRKGNFINAAEKTEVLNALKSANIPELMRLLAGKNPPFSEAGMRIKNSCTVGNMDQRKGAMEAIKAILMASIDDKLKKIYAAASRVKAGLAGIQQCKERQDSGLKSVLQPILANGFDDLDRIGKIVANAEKKDLFRAIEISEEMEIKIKEEIDQLLGVNSNVKDLIKNINQGKLSSAVKLTGMDDNTRRGILIGRFSEFESVIQLFVMRRLYSELGKFRSEVYAATTEKFQDWLLEAAAARLKIAYDKGELK